MWYHLLNLTNPALETSQDIKSIAIVFLFLVIPLFMVSVIAHYIVGFISGLGLFSTFGTGSFGPEYMVYVQGLISRLDQVIILIVAVLIGRLSIQSFRMDMHPIYGIVGLLSIPVIIVMTAFGANIIGFFTEVEFLQESANAFTYSYTLIQNSPQIAAFLSVFIILIMIGGGLLARR